MLMIRSIPAFKDNYIWLIEGPEKHCVVVDPGDASPVLAVLEQENLILDAILITHHHRDHVDGISELKRRYPKTKIVGPDDEAIPGMMRGVMDGDQIDLFGQTFTVIGLSGHTLGHIAYFGNGKLFCGDTLFSAGCGRIFEGTPEQMFGSLNTLAQLPEETQVYCAHEYTNTNIAFALVAEQDNTDLQRYREEVTRLRVQGESTLPSTIGLEKRVNPFLRCNQLSIKKAVSNRAENDTDLATFTALRRWKDEF